MEAELVGPVTILTHAELLGQAERGINQREAPRSAGRCTVGDSDGPRCNTRENPANAEPKEFLLFGPAPVAPTSWVNQERGKEREQTMLQSCCKWARMEEILLASVSSVLSLKAYRSTVNPVWSAHAPRGWIPRAN